MKYTIQYKGKERQLSERDFPITLGSAASAGIFIAGLEKNVEAAVISLDGEHLFLKPAHGIPVLHNKRKMDAGLRLNNGDSIRTGLSEIHIRTDAKSDVCSLHVSDHAAETVSSLKTPIEIEPISFRSRKPMRTIKPVRIVKWFAGIVFGVILIVLAAAGWFVFSARQVVITIEPVPEKIAISGGLITPRVGNYYLMRPGRYGLEALKECFSPLVHTFHVSDEKHQNVHLSMEKLPGRITVHAHQSGIPEKTIAEAQVFIDGTEAGRTPIKELAIKPGLRRLEIRSPNYQDAGADVEIQGCEKLQELNVALLPGWSDITVSSLPPGAEVLIDGVAAGNTPLRLQRAAGTYALEVSAEGYKPWKQRLVVKADEPQEIKGIELEPADGKLAITTDPAGANIVVGEKFIGQTPLLIELSPDRKHSVQISKAGYERASRNVSVQSGVSQKLNVTLKSRQGIIEMLIEPADSELFVDGKSWGTAPKELRMIAVEHTLEFKKKGYTSYRTRITPRPGFLQQLKVVLAKEHASEKTVQTVITTKTGYKLTLIPPGQYTMGSSRREQGRKSNETLREITLTRPFYMGMKEVTNREFRAFMVRHNSGSFKSKDLNNDDQSVVRVTWEQAAMFCNWLSVQDSLPPAYEKKGDRLVAVEPMNRGYRLPTEAEWEYAARFRGKGAPLKYPWGDTFPPGQASGNFADQSAKDMLSTVLEGYKDGYAATAPPASFKPTGPGLYDMGGNAAEWCHDYYTIYSYTPEKTYVDPSGPKDGKHHVVRGSSWKHGSISTLRLAYRSYSDDKREDVGFRVSRYLQ